MQLGLLLNVSALLSQYNTIQNVSDVFRVLLPYVQPAVASSLGLTTVQVGSLVVIQCSTHSPVQFRLEVGVVTHASINAISNAINECCATSAAKHK